MISGTKRLIAALLVLAVALFAWYVVAMPLPVAIHYATDSTVPGWHRSLARLRSRTVLSCPQSSDFAPATPLVYLLSAMDKEDADVEEARALFKNFVRNGCDVDAISSSGHRPIHVAILYRDPDLLKFVMDQGADPGQRTGPNLVLGTRSHGLDASEYLAEICARRDTGCDELRAVLATAKR